MNKQQAITWTNANLSIESPVKFFKQIIKIFIQQIAFENVFAKQGHCSAQALQTCGQMIHLSKKCGTLPSYL